MRKILILGAGLVSRPIVRFFLERGDIEVTVGSLYRSDAEMLTDRHPLGTALEVDVTRDELVEPLVANCDLVVILVPFDFHPQLARFAIEHGVHLVTTSHLSSAMQELDEAAREQVANFLQLSPEDDILVRMEWVGLFDESPLPTIYCNGIDLMTQRFNERMSYADGQRDMVLMRHEVRSRFPDGTTETTISKASGFSPASGFRTKPSCLNRSSTNWNHSASTSARRPRRAMAHDHEF